METLKNVKVRRVRPPDKKTDQRELVGRVVMIISLTTAIITLLTALLK